jgi:GNAT superfamily N-acetyltransferase
MMEVFKAAFGPDPLMEFIFNRPGAPKRSEEERRKRVAEYLERMAAPQWVYHKAVDTENPSGPMLGVAAWYWEENPQNSTQNIPWGGPTSNAHMECYEASCGELRRWRLNYFREHDQPFVCMAILTIMPEAQRRGVGSALLREGLKEVDRRGLPAFIEAAPDGVGLYKKFGWEERVRTSVNLKDFGGEDVDCLTLGMVRPAGAKEIIKESPIA